LSSLDANLESLRNGVSDLPDVHVVEFNLRLQHLGDQARNGLSRLSLDFSVAILHLIEAKHHLEGSLTL
jgi:hypothetical protein